MRRSCDTQRFLLSVERHAARNLHAPDLGHQLFLSTKSIFPCEERILRDIISKQQSITRLIIFIAFEATSVFAATAAQICFVAEFADVVLVILALPALFQTRGVVFAEEKENVTCSYVVGIASQNFTTSFTKIREWRLIKRSSVQNANFLVLVH